MDLISEHPYGGPSESIVKHTRSVSADIHRIVDSHRSYRKSLESLKGKDIRIAFDEWNYGWYSPHIYGEAAPRWVFKDALGIAVTLHEMFRNTDMITMANTHPINVGGHVKTNKTDAVLETTGLVMKLYRQHFGVLPVTVTNEAEPLDIAAAWANERKALTIGIVNPTEQKYELTLELKGAELTGQGHLWQIANSDPMAYNEPGVPPQVVIEEKQVQGISKKLDVSPLSINLCELSVR